MKLLTALCLCLVVSTGLAFAQTAPLGTESALSRLESLSNVALPEWRWHDDVPHPEDPALNDSQWELTKPGAKWSTGTRVFRRWIEIPEKIGGYAVAGARVKLDVAMDSNGPDEIAIFSNGSLVFRGNEDTLQPVLLAENVRPGEKYLVALRMEATEVESNFRRAALMIEPPASRPDPSLLCMELLSARPLIAAYQDGREQREQELNAAIAAIDFAALDKGDQAGFDASLRQAQAKLEALRPWIRQFSIRAVGNSHIDMAWLWPWTETVEVVRNTFESVLNLMREYPDFKFT
ncbi:MAG: alpha-mannosidase, partial [Gammaproteobacteria bacterium]